MNHIEVAIRLVRACGPVSKREIAEEILTHAVGADRNNCEHLAQVAIDHGFETGWITNYEEDDCYVIA